MYLIIKSLIQFLAETCFTAVPASFAHLDLSSFSHSSGRIFIIGLDGKPL